MGDIKHTTKEQKLKKLKTTLFCFKSRIMKLRFDLSNEDRKCFNRLHDSLRAALRTDKDSKALYNKLSTYIDMSNDELWESDILELFRRT